ncbi:MAG: hypothetical protein IPJ95_04410 [Gemmatimonadetes bacterium]|nr:hypothetical protein [Gemmatimonadota bacterium]
MEVPTKDHLAFHASAIEQMVGNLISTEWDAYKAFMLRILMPEVHPTSSCLRMAKGALWRLPLCRERELPARRVSRPDGAPPPTRSIEGDVKAFEIGGDYLLGSYEDAGDVLHIVLHKVGKAPT